MTGDETKSGGVLWLVVGLVVVLIGGVLFVGAVSGWFDDPKVALSAEYYCGEECSGEFMELTKDEYERLIEEKKSFVVFVDQGGCTTADRVRGYVEDYAKEAGVKVYRIMFPEMKETSLHEEVKYYPSVVVVSRGKVVGWLKADSDEDAAAYNNFGDFQNWILRYL